MEKPLFVRDERGWFKLTPTYLGDDGAIGGLLAAQSVRKLPAAFTTKDGALVDAATVGDPSNILCRIRRNRIKLHTHFRESDGVLVPVFQSDTNTLSLQMEWTPPADMAVWFGIRSFYERQQHKFAEAFLYATAVGIGVAGVFKLPLPNLYNHGPICLGRADFVSNTLAGLVDEVVAHLDSATWNTDLMPREGSEPAALRALFSYSLADSTQVPCTQPWHELLRRVSNPHIDRMVEI